MQLAGLLENAISAHRRGDLDAAEAGYARILGADPHHPDARHLLGVVAMQRGDPQTAEREIRAAIAARPEDATFHGNLGEVLRVQGKLEDAEASLRHALALTPGYGDACNNLALVLMATGREEEAVARLHEAISKGAASAETMANLASALRATGRANEAARVLRGLISQAPRFGEARLMLCRLLLEQDQHQAALECAREGLSYPPVDASTHAAAALGAIASGQFSEAREHAQAALEAQDASLDAMVACAVVWLALGRFAEATSLLRRVDDARPGQLEVLQLLGQAGLKSNDLLTAHDACLRVLEARPDDAKAHLALARVLRGREMMAEAEEHIQRARSLDPGGVEAVIEAADLARRRHDMARAREVLQVGLQRVPDHPVLREQLAATLLEAGEVDESRTVLRQLVKDQPDYVAAYQTLALIGRATDEDRVLVEALASRLDCGRVAPPDAAAGHFAAAKMFDDLGDTTRAFNQYRLANAIRRSAIPYDRQAFDAQVQRCTAAFTIDRLKRLHAVARNDAKPIFIVGMPRSGTTLVEQVLASHPRVSAAGEIDVLPRLLPDPGVDLAQALDALDRPSIERLSQIYLNRLRRDVDGAERQTDKTPRNYMALGLAAVLFPGAALVHCRREPLDNCLSIFFQNLEAGNEFAYDPADIAHQFAGYRRLMAHWQRVLPIPVLQLDYEALVTDFEPQCRRLLAFCGLEWDARCLDFHRTGTSVRTASVWQVRQPVYTTSRQRWRRYGENVEPLRQALLAQGIECPSG